MGKNIYREPEALDAKNWPDWATHAISFKNTSGVWSTEFFVDEDDMEDSLRSKSNYELNKQNREVFSEFIAFEWDAKPTRIGSGGIRHG